MMNKKELTFLDDIEKRFGERFEYLRRDLDMILRDLGDIKDTVLVYSAEVEKIIKKQ